MSQQGGWRIESATLTEIPDSMLPDRGSILAFLVFGPMIDLKSTLMFLSVLRRRTVALIVLLVAQAVLLLGLWVNLNVG